METKTATLTKITANGSFDNAYGTMFKWELEFDNGDSGETNTKTAPQTTWEIGKPITYTIEQNGKYAPKIKKAKEQEGQANPVNNNSEFQRPKSPEENRMIIAQSSIGYACTLLQQSQHNDSKSALIVAEEFYTWVCKKGGIS